LKKKRERREVACYTPVSYEPIVYVMGPDASDIGYGYTAIRLVAGELSQERLENWALAGLTGGMKPAKARDSRGGGVAEAAN
jgi:hypothetical protein